MEDIIEPDTDILMFGYQSDIGNDRLETNPNILVASLLRPG
jgi:hypothetical protein